ncbi:MAG: PAS domain-containing protein [Afipia sp.]|nr:PAS domain-containing protein [Afipia sp.]
MPENQFKLIKSIPQFFLDGLGVGFKLIDATDGGILAANNSICGYLGYSRDELLSGAVTFKSVTHPEDWANTVAQQHLLLSGKLKRYDADQRYVRKDGSIFWAHINCASLVDPRGKVRWTTCTVEDISDQVIAQEHLAIAKKLSGFATWNWQVKSNSSEISQNYNKLFGLPAKTRSPSIEEFIARVHPDDRRIVSRSLERALGGGSYSHEYRMARPNGEIRWMRSMAQGVRDANGTVANLIGVTLDITNEKATHTELAPRYIVAALEFMENNWRKSISLPEISRACGASTSTLFKFFRSRGTSPGQILKKIKLRHANETLSAPSKTTTVSGVALKCGFQNLGHFSRYYRDEFGELPSATLSRNKR